MQNRSRSSRAAMAAMVVAVMSMSAVGAEAGIRRYEADPGAGGLWNLTMRNPLAELERIFGVAIGQTGYQVLRMWDTFDEVWSGNRSRRPR